MEAISRASASEPDCARYQIFGTLPSDAVARSSRESAADPDDAASIAEALEATRAACMSHLEPHVEGYIWQKDPFQLEVVAATPPGTSRSGAPAHLAGVTRFGDNVEDEWFIVWMLRELTRAFPALVARVWDDDGEFLLIETAFHLPRWLKPETAANRVWLCGGEMRVVPPEADARLGIELADPVLDMLAGHAHGADEVDEVGIAPHVGDEIEQIVGRIAQPQALDMLGGHGRPRSGGRLSARPRGRNAASRNPRPHDSSSG